MIVYTDKHRIAFQIAEPDSARVREAQGEGEAMKIICSWCGCVIRDGTGQVSHGLCPVCWPKIRAAAGLPAHPYPQAAE